MTEWAELGERLRGMEPVKFAEVMESLRAVVDAQEMISRATLGLVARTARHHA